MESNTAVIISTHHRFISGATCALMGVAAVKFLRFYRRMNDPLFLLFSLSFFLQALDRLAVDWLVPVYGSPGEQGADGMAPFYLLRLVAYGLIILAIVHKNRPGQRLKSLT